MHHETEFFYPHAAAECPISAPWRQNPSQVQVPATIRRFEEAPLNFGPEPRDGTFKFMWNFFRPKMAILVEEIWENASVPHSAVCVPLTSCSESAQNSVVRSGISDHLCIFPQRRAFESRNILGDSLLSRAAECGKFEVFEAVLGCAWDSLCDIQVTQPNTGPVVFLVLSISWAADSFRGHVTILE